MAFFLTLKKKINKINGDNIIQIKINFLIKNKFYYLIQVVK